MLLDQVVGADLAPGVLGGDLCGLVGKPRFGGDLVVGVVDLDTSAGQFGAGAVGGLAGGGGVGVPRAACGVGQLQAPLLFGQGGGEGFGAGGAVQGGLPLRGVVGGVGFGLGEGGVLAVAGGGLGGGGQFVSDPCRCPCFLALVGAYPCPERSVCQFGFLDGGLRSAECPPGGVPGRAPVDGSERGCGSDRLGGVVPSGQFPVCGDDPGSVLPLLPRLRVGGYRAECFECPLWRLLGDLVGQFPLAGVGQ